MGEEAGEATVGVRVLVGDVDVDLHRAVVFEATDTDEVAARSDDALGVDLGAITGLDEKAGNHHVLLASTAGTCQVCSPLHHRCKHARTSVNLWSRSGSSVTAMAGTPQR